MRTSSRGTTEDGGGVAGVLAHMSEISDDLEMLPSIYDDDDDDDDHIVGGSRGDDEVTAFHAQLLLGGAGTASGARRKDPRASSIPALANAPEALRPAGAPRSKMGHLSLAPRVSQVLGYKPTDRTRATTETAAAAARIRAEKLSIEAPAALGAAAAHRQSGGAGDRFRHKTRRFENR